MGEWIWTRWLLWLGSVYSTALRLLLSPFAFANQISNDKATLLSSLDMAFGVAAVSSAGQLLFYQAAGLLTTKWYTEPLYTMENFLALPLSAFLVAFALGVDDKQSTRHLVLQVKAYETVLAGAIFAPVWTAYPYLFPEFYGHGFGQLINALEAWNVPHPDLIVGEIIGFIQILPIQIVSSIVLGVALGLSISRCLVASASVDVLVGLLIQLVNSQIGDIATS